MFTPHMTNEELQAAAYRDFLEIRMKVKLVLEQFIHRIRHIGEARRAIHSLMEEKKVTTKSKNTWHIVLVNNTYTPAGVFIAGCFVYIPLYRGDEVDYLFINNTEDFILQKLSAHFLARYKERYIEYKGINLRGMHPALYYMTHNQDNTLTVYLPENWAEKEVKETTFMVSKQGLSYVRVRDRIITYVTFLDQENLSRYKAMVYEEEAFWKDYQRIGTPGIEFEAKQAIYKKLCADPEKSKQLLVRYMRRRVDKSKLTEETEKEFFKTLEEQWNEVVEITRVFDEKLQEMAEEAKPRDLLDIGIGRLRK